MRTARLIDVTQRGNALSHALSAWEEDESKDMGYQKISLHQHRLEGGEFRGRHTHTGILHIMEREIDIQTVYQSKVQIAQNQFGSEGQFDGIFSRLELVIATENLVQLEVRVVRKPAFRIHREARFHIWRWDLEA